MQYSQPGLNQPYIAPPRVGGLRARRTLFWILAFASLGFIVVGMTVSAGAVEAVKATPAGVIEGSSLDQETATELRDLGADIGGGILSTGAICIGLPFFILFSFLAWRNGSGLRTELRHHEQMQMMAQQSGMMQQQFQQQPPYQPYQPPRQ